MTIFGIVMAIGAIVLPVFAYAPMSAFGTKRTSTPLLRMSAFGGKADMSNARPNVCF